MEQTKRVFAIKMGNWVEIRTGKTPPKPITTKATFTTKEKKMQHLPVPTTRRLDFYGWTFAVVDAEKTKTMEQTVYKGGRALCPISLREFTANAKEHKFDPLPPKGWKLYEIPQEWVGNFLDKNWRKNNIGKT